MGVADKFHYLIFKKFILKYSAATFIMGADG
jgi:hypothetical protein